MNGELLLGMQVVHMVVDLLQDDVADIRAAADDILETAICEEPSYAEGIRTLRFEACNAQWLASLEQPLIPGSTVGPTDEPDDAGMPSEI